MKTSIILLTLISTQVFASPKVIATIGPTYDASIYLNNSLFAKQADQVPSRAEVSTDQIVEALNQQYQVKTTKLTPGTEQSRGVSFPQLLNPVFIVGDDQASQEWLINHRDRLKQLRAIGYIVNLTDKAEYDQIVANTGFSLIPVNGDSFAEVFKIQHYPVLISQKLIEQ